MPQAPPNHALAAQQLQPLPSPGSVLTPRRLFCDAPDSPVEPDTASTVAEPAAGEEERSEQAGCAGIDDELVALYDAPGASEPEWPGALGARRGAAGSTPGSSPAPFRSSLLPLPASPSPPAAHIGAALAAARIRAHEGVATPSRNSRRARPPTPGAPGSGLRRTTSHVRSPSPDETCRSGSQAETSQMIVELSQVRRPTAPALRSLPRLRSARFAHARLTCFPAPRAQFMCQVSLGSKRTLEEAGC